MNIFRYSSMKTEEVFKELKISKRGLPQSEIFQRQKKYGRNEIEARQVHWWEILLRQFSSSFIYLLIGAMALNFFLRQFLDGSMILLFVVINAALGFYQEYRSEQSLKILKRYIIHESRVRRNNKEENIDSKLLVPGDIITVESGDIIPADIRFFLEHNLMVDESILTGETAPIKKTVAEMGKEAKEIYQACNMGFSGTTVISGVGEGIVIATGKNMVIGEVANLTVETERESSFEKGIKRLSSFVLRLILVTLLFVFLANIFIKGDSTDAMELVVFSIALAVSVIPEALPIVTTFSLSHGALKLAKNKVVVRRLSAIEDLGSIEVLCTDKTGTLTENELAVSNIYSKDPGKTLFYATLAFSILERKLKKLTDAFDLAIIQKISSADKKTLDLYKRISEIPFDPERRRNSVLVSREERCQLVVRGAYEHIVPFSINVDSGEKKEIADWAAEEGKGGHRVIAVAKKEISNESGYAVSEEENNLEFIGLISFVDPIKKTTKAAVDKAKKLGVDVKILTGDSAEVAGAVGYQVGLIDSPKKVIMGEKLEEMSFRKQREAVKEYAVFARISPRQKYNIIQLLQEEKEVGFLGEGINDAPALKIANVGLVVQGAADVSREAADIVLMKKSLEVIIDGIKEGRMTFINTIKYIKITLASNFGNFYAVAIASLIVDFLPMLPLQILLVNLLSDLPMVTIATDNIDEKELVRPKSYDIKEIALVATILGIVSSVFDFMVFSLFYKIGPGVLQTNWFIASILTELFFLFSLRTKMAFFKAKRPSGMMIFLSLLAVAITIALPFTKFGQDVFQFVKPSGNHLFLILSIVIVYFAVTESVKLIYYRYIKQE